MKNPFNKNYFAACARGNSKEFFLVGSPALGNLILDDGRYDLLPVEKLTPKDFKITMLDGKKIIERVTEPNKPEILKPETFFQKLKRKYPHVINLTVGVIDLFTRGTATRIKDSIYAIFTDETETENKNIISNKYEGNAMLDTFKNFVTGFVTRWILKIGGGFLLSVGVNEGSVTEIVAAVCSILIGLAISLFQQKKALETDLTTIKK